MGGDVIDRQTGKAFVNERATVRGFLFSKEESMTTWEPGIFVMHGMVYEYRGRVYRARYGHTALPEFPPDKTPDLFDPIKN